MYITIDEIRIFYQRHFADGLPIILLHGWGASSVTMQPIYDYFCKKGRNVVSIDLAGFGQSQPPKPHYGIYEYAELVKRFLMELSIDNAIIVGHSFGGRIAIVLAATTNICHRIVLVDSAGIKPRRGLAYYIRVYKYKRAKRANKDLSSFGSEDYRTLSDSMKQVFTRVVNQFLNKLLKSIKCPTLIIWGENDTDTPLYMARRINKGVRDSGLVVLKNCGHFSYLDDIRRFNLVLEEFCKSNYS